MRVLNLSAKIALSTAIAMLMIIVAAVTIAQGAEYTPPSDMGKPDRLEDGGARWGAVAVSLPVRMSN